MLKLKALGRNICFYKKEQLTMMQLGVLADTLVKVREGREGYGFISRWDTLKMCYCTARHTEAKENAATCLIMYSMLYWDGGMVVWQALFPLDQTYCIQSVFIKAGHKTIYCCSCFRCIINTGVFVSVSVSCLF